MWITLLIVLSGYVVANFARTPFLASSGSAAVRPAQVTLCQQVRSHHQQNSLPPGLLRTPKREAVRLLRR